MSRLVELTISIVVLIVAFLIELNPGSLRLIRNDFRNTSWLFGVLLIILFSLGVNFYRTQDDEHKERLIESLKKAIMAFIIAYLAHLDFTLVPFWLVFIVAFFFHDWV